MEIECRWFWGLRIDGVTVVEMPEFSIWRDPISNGLLIEPGRFYEIKEEKK